MKAPICRVCGKAHWGNEPHVWGVVERQETDIEALRSPPNFEPKAELSGEVKFKEVSAEALRKRRWREKNREHYNTYMRRYMAKWRKDAK